MWQYEPPRPTYWTCSACAYKFNAPPDECDGGVAACDLCGREFEETGPVRARSAVVCVHVCDCAPAAPTQHKKWTAAGCWRCPACAFGANTLGLDDACQVCGTALLSDEDARMRYWFCPQEECKYENREDVRLCDCCRVGRSPLVSM